MATRTVRLEKLVVDPPSLSEQERMQEEIRAIEAEMAEKTATDTVVRRLGTKNIRYPTVYYQGLIDHHMTLQALDLTKRDLTRERHLVRSMVDAYRALVEKDGHLTELGFVQLKQLQLLVSVCKVIPRATGILVAPHRNAVELLPDGTPELLSAIGRAKPDAPVLEMSVVPGLPSCALCGKDALMRCSRCLNTAYCSAECQKDDYTVHKKPCMQVGNERNALRQSAYIPGRKSKK